MDIQYHGGNCVTLTSKDVRIVVDDNLEELGLKRITRQGDIALFTSGSRSEGLEARLVIDQPGEYEVSGLSITGIPVQGHMDRPNTKRATAYKIVADDATYLFTGHIYPNLTDEQLEIIGMVDVLFVPVGGNGYTVDPIGALELIKKIEPKLVVPTHYADKSIRYSVEQQTLEQVLKNLGMEPQETVVKLRVKPAELSSGTTQLTVVTKS